MNRKILTAAFAALAVFATALPAFAQETRPVGLSARAGVFLPTASAARNQSDAWFAGGLEYRIQEMRLGTMDAGTASHLALSVDFYGSGDFRHTPVLANYVVRQNEFFYSVGAGVGIGRVQVSQGSESRTRFAYQVGVGYDFQRGQNPMFIEAKYFGSAESELNGIGLYVGIRF
jgi:hypothetical protein